MPKDPKPCTICQKNDSLGIGVGKLKSTCAECIASLIAEGTCPACRGVETYSPEHIAGCDGKLPKAEKGTTRTRSSKVKKGATGGAKSPSQIGKEAAANKRSEERRAVRTPTKEEAAQMVADAEAVIKDLTDNGGTEKQMVAAKKKLVKAKEVQAAAERVPDGRCPECNCFLADNGRCVNEECVLVKS